MSGRYRAAGLVCVCLGLLALSVASALGYTGTRKGKRLTAQLLASYKHVHYLAGSNWGSVYYCPSQVGGYVVAAGFQPPASCAKHRAKASWVQTLSHGKGVSAVGTVTAKHRPTITFVATNKATFIKAKGARCWTKQYTDYQFVASPPFGFYPKEYMTVGHKHGNEIDLIGRMSGAGGFMETDTLNASSHQMIGESIYWGLDHKQTEEHLLSHYHQVHQAAAVPHTHPVC